jgi:hypothetical protein
MKQFVRGVLALAVVLAAAGCQPPPQPAPAGTTNALGIPPAPPPPPGAAPAGAAVAGQATAQLQKPKGYFTQAQIEQMLREQWNVVELDLRSTGGHNFAGTIKVADGQTLTLKIKQVDGGIKWWHDNGRGGTGTFAWGNPVPD